MNQDMYNVYSALYRLDETLRQIVVPLLEQNSMNQFKIIELLEKIHFNSMQSNAKRT